MEKKPSRVTVRLQNVDNRQSLTQISKIDNAFASSIHFSNRVNEARAVLYDFLAKYSPDLHVPITHPPTDHTFFILPSETL